MPNIEDEDNAIIAPLLKGSERDSLVEEIKKKKKRDEEREAQLKALIDAPQRKFIPD